MLQELLINDNRNTINEEVKEPTSEKDTQDLEKILAVLKLLQEQSTSNNQSFSNQTQKDNEESSKEENRHVCSTCSINEVPQASLPLNIKNNNKSVQSISKEVHDIVVFNADISYIGGVSISHTGNKVMCSKHSSNSNLNCSFAIDTTKAMQVEPKILESIDTIIVMLNMLNNMIALHPEIMVRE